MVITMKKTVLFFMVIFLMIGVCGCMVFDRDTSIEEQMIAKMNEKYSDDTFEYKSPFGGGAGVDSKTIIVSSQKYPGKDIYVRYMDGEYTDNYLSVKYQEQTENLIRNTLNNVLECDYLLIYEPNRYACPNSNGEISFEEYIGQEKSSISFTVVSREKVLDKTLFEKTIEAAVIKAGICVTAGTIYFDNGSDEFDTLTAENLAGYTFKKLYCDVFVFEMIDNKEFTTSSWGDL